MLDGTLIFWEHIEIYDFIMVQPNHLEIASWRSYFIVLKDDFYIHPNVLKLYVKAKIFIPDPNLRISR